MDVKKPVEQCESFEEANEARKGPSPSERPTAARLRVWKTKLVQTATERKTEQEVHAKIGAIQAMHCTTLRTEAGTLEDPSIIQFSPGYSVCPQFVKDVHQDCIQICCLPPVLPGEALEQIYKANSHS